VDFDNDDRLDLYNTCGRVADDPKDYPHTLYRRESGGYQDVAPDVGLVLPHAGYFVRLVGDGDGDLDLLASLESKIRLYLNSSYRFEAQSELSLAATVTQLAVADFDLDGDFDVYIVTKDRSPNSLLINNDGQYRPLDPQEFGLPAQGVDASWVDYDNDGAIDLHVVPKGLYRQIEGHRFKATQLFNWQVPPFETWEARSAWFDRDNDGTRDLAIAYRQTPSALQSTPSLRQRIINQIQKRDTSKIWQSAFYQNVGAKNHWLQIKLAGNGGNNPAIGAKVEVTTPMGVQIQQVGMSENSHYSQGHYRLYFGLGKYPKADLVKITWSNGEVTELNNLTGDRLLKVEQEAA
ncbi:MAG: CRTAC1 family protein, partial [Pleurocapsa sp.]